MTSRFGVVTRFAPSPTGYLHIGGARTALFNWLYAKHTGGTFLLRIEDTDRARSTDAAIAAILDGLKWLGIDWDGDVTYQFARAERHAEIAQEMIARGSAFRCYVPQEALEARRAEGEAARQALAAAKKNKAPDAEIARLQAEVAEKTSAFRSPYRDDDKQPPAKDAPFVVRLRAPAAGDTVIQDGVQGRVSWQNKDLDDMVLLRSDGTPTYMLAVVVDDHDMGVTHVIRGDDHLTNAARQTQIYHAMDWKAPAFSHIPLIHGPDGAKLSKRHGALGVEAYRAMGYLPSALRNYLARLGWAHGDDEIFSMEQAVDWFSLEAIGRSPSRFDFAKLENLNGHYIRHTPDAELVADMLGLYPILAAEGGLAYDLTPDRIRNLEQSMPGLKERAKTLKELWESAAYLFHARVAGSAIPLDEKAGKLLTSEARAHLAVLHDRFRKSNAWTAEVLEALTRAYAEETGTKLGNVAQPLRAALTGRAVSPPIFDVLAVLGRDEGLARIADHMKTD